MNKIRKYALKMVTILVVTILLVLAIGIVSALAKRPPPTKSTTHPAGIPIEIPIYNEPFEGEGPHNPPIWRTYKDYNAWWGENRDHSTLLALGKIQGYDYFIHPMSALQLGIPDGTDVVLIASNSEGWSSTRNSQKHPIAQSNIGDFLQRGGILIVDMGDNDYNDGYRAPGAAGTPNYTFPSPCGDATLNPAAVADNHPFFPGLNNSNIDVTGSCYIAHGNLANGITLPGNATNLITATFNGIQKPVLAEYTYESGCVIVDTITKEWEYQNPAGYGSSNIMHNLFSYALRGGCSNRVEIDIKAGIEPNNLYCQWGDLVRRGIFDVAILTTDSFNATTVDHSTVSFEGAKEIHFDRRTGILRRHELDVDRDGDIDLLFHFRLGDTNLSCFATEGYLRGRTFSGDYFFGVDSVRMVNYNPPRPTPTPPPYYAALPHPPNSTQAKLTFGLLTFGLLFGASLVIGLPSRLKNRK